MEGGRNQMKARNAAGRGSAWPTWLALALAWMALGLMGQGTLSVPGRMIYQGYLNGLDGQPLGASAPKAFDMTFRIYSAETGGTQLWAEQQTAIVDKGYFGVQLGEGTAVPGFTNPSAGLPAVFAATTGSDRWVELTVAGAGAGGSSITVSPRVRLVSAPYAYLAQAAARLVDVAGNEVMSMSSSNLNVTVALTAPSISVPTMTVGSITVSNTLNLLGSTSGGGGVVRTPEGGLRMVAGRHGWTNNFGTFLTEPSPGYSVTRITNGEYRVTFDTPFSSPPSVTATAMARNAYWIQSCVIIQSQDPAVARAQFTVLTWDLYDTASYSAYKLNVPKDNWNNDARRDFLYPSEVFTRNVFPPSATQRDAGFAFVASGN